MLGTFIHRKSCHPVCMPFNSRANLNRINDSIMRFKLMSPEISTTTDLPDGQGEKVLLQKMAWTFLFSPLNGGSKYLLRSCGKATNRRNFQKLFMIFQMTTKFSLAISKNSPWEYLFSFRSYLFDHKQLICNVLICKEGVAFNIKVCYVKAGYFNF